MKRIVEQFSRLILAFGVFLYVVFEELVWDLIAQPVYAYLRDLRLLQRIEVKVLSLKPLTLLSLFLLLFIQVEGLSIFALGLLAQGRPVLGISLYLAKLPIAAFTFWLFRISKEILMTFAWFKFSYETMAQAVDFIKATSIHKNIVAWVMQIKQWLKSKTAVFRQVFHAIKANLRKYLAN